MKVQKVILGDLAIKENENGEYEAVLENEKTYPAMLTNYALKKGEELGLLDSSLFDDVFAFAKLQNGDARDIDDIRVLSVIYLGIIGANKKLELTFEEFLDKYHQDMSVSIALFADLVTAAVEGKSNNFADGLRKSTAISKGKK